MTRPRWQVWAVALAVTILAAPLAFLAGVFAIAGLNHAFGPSVSGEALQGRAFAAFLFGGPIGLLVGGAFALWLGHRLGRSAGFVAIAGLCTALALASARALVELGLW